MQKEIWKDIPEYEGYYQVSNLGRVKSLDRFIDKKNNRCFFKGKILKININKNGYCFIVLYKNKKSKNLRIHQLVSMAFLNHKPCGMKLVVDHINDIKTDNRLENLQIVTTRYNAFKTQSNYSSKYKGVHWDNERKKWSVSISINGKSNRIGRFKDEYDAHLAYQNKLKEIENG